MKRYIAILTSVMMLLSFANVFTVSAEATSWRQYSGQSKSDEYIRVIVELDSPSMMDETSEINTYGSSPDGRTRAAAIEAEQGEIKRMINSNIDAEFDYSYKNVMNGFSANIKLNDVDRVRRMEGVKEVYVVRAYEHPITYAGDSYSMSVGVNCYT